MPLNVIICQELNNPDEDNKLCWYLYTNEPINNIEDAKRIVRYYELRWRIEDFHKVWKSDGTQVEKLRMQTRANMERMSTILAFVAIRLMQLKE
ncbi:MAG: transposase [Paraglaciecola sp.]